MAEILQWRRSYFSAYPPIHAIRGESGPQNMYMSIHAFIQRSQKVTLERIQTCSQNARHVHIQKQTMQTMLSLS
jgi:hypothetical protein